MRCFSYFAFAGTLWRPPLTYYFKFFCTKKKCAALFYFMSFWSTLMRHSTPTWRWSYIVSCLSTLAIRVLCAFFFFFFPSILHSLADCKVNVLPHGSTLNFYVPSRFSAFSFPSLFQVMNLQIANGDASSLPSIVHSSKRDADTCGISGVYLLPWISFELPETWRQSKSQIWGEITEDWPPLFLFFFSVLTLKSPFFLSCWISN